jgi:hypothetical protein
MRVTFVPLGATSGAWAGNGAQLVKDSSNKEARHRVVPFHRRDERWIIKQLRIDGTMTPERDI